MGPGLNLYPVPSNDGLIGGDRAGEWGTDMGLGAKNGDFLVFHSLHL